MDGRVAVVVMAHAGVGADGAVEGVGMQNLEMTVLVGAGPNGLLQVVGALSAVSVGV